MNPINIEGIECLIGTKISKVCPGVGTFLNIYSYDKNTDTEYQIWLYLTQWAITKNGNEVISSDRHGNIYEFNYSSVLPLGSEYKEIISLDNEEIKIMFSNKVNLEIWGDSDAYGTDFRYGVSISKW